MADGRKIPYIIEMLPDTKQFEKIRSKLKAIDGGEFIQFSPNEVKKLKNILQGVIEDVGDRASSIGAKIQEGIASGIDKDKLQKMLELDTTKLRETMELVEKLTGLIDDFSKGSSWLKDGKGFLGKLSGSQKDLINLEKTIGQLEIKFEGLDASLNSIIAKFDILATTIKGLQSSSKPIVVSPIDVTTGTKQIQKFEKEISELNELLSKISNTDIKPKTDNAFKDFHRLSKEAQALSDEIDDLIYDATQPGISKDDKRNLIMQVARSKAQRAQIYRDMEGLNEQYQQTHPNVNLFDGISEDPKKIIAEAKKYIEGIVKTLSNVTSSKTSHSDNAIGIEIALPSVDDIKKKLNDVIDQLNTPGSLHKIKLEIDDVANVIADKQVRAYGDNPGDDDVNTSELVKKTEARLDRVAKSIEEKLTTGEGSILSKTKAWRKQMLDQFKFNKGDFEFKFNNAFIEELQALFDEYGLKINIDPTYLADQIKTVLSDSNISVSGGTANIDQASMTTAIRDGVLAALLGKQLPTTPIATSGQERISDATEQTATEIEQTAKHLDIAEEYVQDVVKKLKAVANYATKHIGTAQDTNGARETRKKFGVFGIDLEKIKALGDDDTAIAKMLSEDWEDTKGNKHPSLFKHTDFGKLVGSTVIDELSSFKGSSSNTIPAFVESLREMFYMLQEDTQTIEEWKRQKDSREIFNYARGRAQAADSLRGVRSPIRTGKIPDIEYIDKAIEAMSAIGKNTDDLKALKLAREKLGSNTDAKSMQEFDAVAKEFYQKTTNVFYDLKKQAEDAFKGTIYLQGNKKGVVKKQNIENYKHLARIGDNEVILDIKVTSSLNDVPIDTDSKMSPYQAKKLLEGKHGDYIVSPEYESDILRRKLEYDGFKPQGAPTTEVNLDKTLESNIKKRERLMAEIAANEEENKLLRQQIETADKQIADLTAKNNAIPQSDRDAAIKKLAVQEAKKNQLTSDIFWLEEEVGNGKEGDEKKVGSLTKQIEEQLNKRVAAEKQLAELSELDVERRKKSLANKINEIENNDLPKLQQELADAQIRYNMANSDKILAQVEVNKAQSALKAIPKTKANAQMRTEAETRVNKAKIELARSIARLEEAAKDVESLPAQIENSKRQITSLQGQISETTLETIRQEQIDRIETINSTITSLENEFALKFSEKKKKETALKRTNTTIDKIRNDVILGTQRELDEAIAGREGLINRGESLDSVNKAKQEEVYRIELLNQRIKAEKEYNLLQEKSMVLQGSIKKMEEDGATEDALSDKRTELEKINGELSEALTKVQGLGGFLGQREVREYTDAERKTYALEQIQKIDDDLITARAQKNVVAARIAKKDKEIAEVDRWGLGAGIGARVLNQEKYKATSEFMNSEYVRSLIDTARQQTKDAIAQAISESKIAETNITDVFNSKVANAMIKDGLNPYDKAQTNAFLQTERGKQYSNDYNSSVADIQNELEEYTRTAWSLFDQRTKEIRTQVLAEFKESMSVDNGVLTHMSKVKDESGEWISEIVQVYVRDALRQRLVDAKEILEEEQAPIQGNIDRLYADRKTAIHYGGVSEKEILSANVIEDQIRIEESLAREVEKRANSLQKINDLHQAGVTDSDESIKQENKTLAAINKQIAYLEMLIRNRKKLVELRWEESKADQYTDEENQLGYTSQIVNYNQKIEDSLARQEVLKQKINSASEEEKTKLQYQLSKEEENVARWKKNITTAEGKLQKIETSTTTDKETPSDNMASLIKQAIGSADVDLTPITEILKQILAVLSGNGSVSINNADMDAKLTRMKELEAKQQVVNASNKNTQPSVNADEVWKSITSYKSAEQTFTTLQARARELKAELDKMYDEGKADTVDFIKAQTELSRVVTLMRNKFSEKHPEVYGEPGNKESAQQARALWEKYLTTGARGRKKTFDNLDNVPLTSISKKDFASRVKALSRGTIDEGVAGSGLTRKEKKELTRLRKETKGYDPTTGTTSEFGGLATENTLRGILEVLRKISSNGIPRGSVKTKTTTGGTATEATTGDVEELDELTKRVVGLKSKFEDAVKVGYLDSEDAGLVAFNNQLKQIEQQIAKGGTGKAIDDLRKKALALGDTVNTTVAKNRRAYSGLSGVDSAKKQKNQIDLALEDGKYDVQASSVVAYRNEYQKLIDMYEQYRAANKLSSAEVQNELDKQATKVNQLGKGLSKSLQEAAELERLVEQSGSYQGNPMGKSWNINATEVSNLEATMRSYLQTMGLGNIEHLKFDHTHQKLTGTIRTSNRTVADLEMRYNEATGALYAYQKAERESLTGLPAFLSGFKKKMNSIMQYLTMTMSIHRVLAELRKGIQYVREIDLALTELRKVTDETKETYDEFLKTAAQTGARLGSTISAVTEATATFAKLGYTMKQASEMAEAAIVYKNVGDGIASTEDAANSIISTLKGFGMEASEAMSIIDKFNEVGNKFAITSQGIGEALRLSASALNEGKNSLDESIALITAANEVVNDPSSVGTALKTLTLRLRGSKTELEEMGEDVSDMATTTSQLQAKLLALTGGKVDIMLDENTFKNSTQILREMAAAWEDMTDIQRANALELMGGKRQANILSALIQNFETVEKVIETSANSAGSALRENERYLDSIQGKIDQFNNAMQAMWSNTLDSDMVKGFVSFGTELIKIIDKVGLLKSLLITLATVSMVKNKMGPIEFLGGISNLIRELPSKITKLAKSFVAVPTATSAASRAMQGLTVASFQQSLATAGVAESNQAALLSQMGLTEANAAHVIGQQTLNASTLTAAINNGTLTAAQATQLASTYGLTGAIATLNAAQMSQALITAGISREQRLAVMSSLALGAQTKALSADQVMQALTSAGVSQAQSTQIASALGLSVANKGLAASFTALWTAMWPVLLVMLAIGAVVGIVKLFDAMIVTTEELSEELEKLDSEISQLESEITSLESELETVQERMEELLALPSLSFVEQEELDKLTQTADQLERQLKISEALLESKKADKATQTREYIENVWSGDDVTPYRTDARGVIEDAGEKDGDMNAKDALAESIEEYARIKEIDDRLSRALSEWKDGDDAHNQEVLAKYGLNAGLTKEKIQDSLKVGEKNRGDLAGGINEILGDEHFQDLEYGMSDEIDAFLDEYYAYYLAWQQAQGAYVKSDAISSMFNSTSTKELQAVEKRIQEIMNDDTITDKNQAILNYLGSLDGVDDGVVDINNLADSYERLGIAMDVVGVTSQDIADYFLLQTGKYNSRTIEGITNQYGLGLDNLKKMSEDQSLFEGLFDGDGKVIETRVAEMMKGADKTTREEFSKLLQEIKDGAYRTEEGLINWGAAMESFSLSGGIRAVELAMEQLSTINIEIFPGLEDEIQGIIDKFDELAAAVRNTVDAMDILDQARAEEAYSGSISLETLERLMQSTDNYAELIEVDETGAIRLAADAQEVLVQEKINAIKTNAELALKNAQLRLEEAKHNQQIYKDSSPAQEVLRSALVEVGAAAAFVTSLWNDLTSGNLDGAWTRAQQAAASAKTTKQNEYASQAAAAATSVSEAEKAVEEAEKMNNIAQALTPENIKGKYESGEYSTPEEAAQGQFQADMDYWENRIAANQAKYEQIQNEIDLMESKGQKADASFYQEQINLENERLWLLGQQKVAALAYLATLEEGSEEWWEVANTLNNIEGEIDDVTASLVDLQDAIGEIDTYKFEEFNNRLDNLANKLQTIRDLIAPEGEEDWFDDEGNWTDSGIAVLGSYLQELETYKQGYQNTMDELAKYESPYEGNEAYYESLGIHSEQELYDKTEGLISQQYDFAASISDTEQEIVGMYESSIDAVEEYTETLIDGYNDYIDSVKEALDAERDLYDFKKNVQKQAKDIAEIERRIASLSGSTNKADIAERRKLEAQLYESRESLNDTYYDHAKDAQNEALEAEASAYEETMNRMIEGMRASLEEATADMDTFLNNVTIAVSMNADTVLEKYRETNVYLDPALTNPWENAKTKVGEYGDAAKNLMDVWKKDGYFAEYKSTASTNLSSPWDSGVNAANTFKSSVFTVMSDVVSNIASNVKQAQGLLSNLTADIHSTNVQLNGTVGNSYSGNTGSSGSTASGTTSSTPTIPQQVDNAISSKYKLTAEQVLALGYGPLSLSGFEDLLRTYQIKYSAIYRQVANTNAAERAAKKVIFGEYISGPLAVRQYAKGTTGTPRDEWAITDEPKFGDELVLVPGKDGNLSFMRKGTGVVPADLTANLMEWGQFTPDSLNVGAGVNINMINNAVNKPEFNFEFDALVKAENITEETLPAIKKLVTQELNRFTKELNYALKGKGAR